MNWLNRSFHLCLRFTTFRIIKNMTWVWCIHREVRSETETAKMTSRYKECDLTMKEMKKEKKFKIMSVLTATLYLYLFLSMLLYPETVSRDFGIAGTEAVCFLVRRASSLMLGFAVLLLLARNESASGPRRMVSLVVSLNMAGFAVSSAHGLLGDYVGISLLAPMLIETVVAGVYLYFWLSDGRLMQGVAK